MLMRLWRPVFLI